MQDVFYESIPLLEAVINQKRVISCKLSKPVIQQLYEVYQQTEYAWHKNLKRFNSDSEINYLLVCEAPPWTFCSTTTYFYLQPQGPLFSAVRKAFFGDQSQDRVKTYDMLAEKGFMLVDSLPYALSYTANQRKSTAYLNLVKANAPLWINKLNSSKLNFSPDLKIALGYFWNGLRLIEVFGGDFIFNKQQLQTVKQATISLAGKTYQFDTSSLVSKLDTGYFPSSKEIKSIYNIKVDIKYP